MPLGEPMIRISLLAFWAILLGLSSVAAASDSDADDMVKKLQKGGLVILMRHANSPRDLPTEDEAARRNVNLERQLSEAGISSATDMGLSWRAAGIHVSAVYTSPAFRAEQTARYAGYGTPQLVIELDSGSAQTDEGIAWLQLQAARRVGIGNRLIITHASNISAAIGDAGRGMMDGDALIIEPGPDGPTILGRIDINRWPQLLLGD